MSGQSGVTGKYTLIAVGLVLLAAIVSLSLVAQTRATEVSRGAPMSDDERIDWFWGIIERTRSPGADQDQQMAALAAELSELPPAQIEAFGAIFDRLLVETYSWDMWGAAYVIMGGASDDGFEYFRVWLISRGREVFERARANPDELATLIPADFEEVPDFELLAYVASNAWAEKTGEEPNEMPTQPGMMYSHAPSGEPFDETPEDLGRRYPRLWARFSESPLG
jgi:hypothetical protein